MGHYSPFTTQLRITTPLNKRPPIKNLGFFGVNKRPPIIFKSQILGVNKRPRQEEGMTEMS